MESSESSDSESRRRKRGLACHVCGKVYANKVLFGNHFERLHADRASVDTEPQGTNDRSNDIPALGSEPLNARVGQTAPVPTPKQYMSRASEEVDLILQEGINSSQANDGYLSPAAPSESRVDQLFPAPPGGEGAPSSEFEFDDPGSFDTPDPKTDHISGLGSSAKDHDEIRTGEGDVACEVYNFFESFNDTHEKMYPRVGQLSPSIEKLSTGVRSVLEYCTANCLTLGEAKGLYNLLAGLETHGTDRAGPITSEFKTPDSFASYLDNARKITVRNEGWLTAVINSDLGENKTGVFRPVIDLMLGEIREAGGASAIMPFKEEKEGDQRVFSAPWNCEAMREYHRSLNEDSRIVMVDLHSDGTTLSSTGTQSANNMRVRFCNLRGKTDIWYEVSIVPTVVLDIRGPQLSKEAIKKEKIKLWHRFTFLVLQEVLQMSHVGIVVDGIVVYPRLGMLVTDQVQERPSCCLKGHGSLRDCTLCDMPSRLGKRKTDAECQARKRAKTESDAESATSMFSYGSDGYDSKVEGTSEQNGVREIQTGTESYPRRNVYKTVKGQLAVSARNRIPAKRARVDSSVWEARQYLIKVSAIDFPPVHAAFSGSGSFPFRLYASVGFDKLHVVEHGILRQVTDDMYKVFQSNKQYNGMTKGDIATICNQRILDLPRSAQLPRISPFRKGGDEKHAGVTGKIRRELAPFLWYSVMGVSRIVDPDDDIVVQLLLQIDCLQSELLGINRCAEFARKTRSGIDKLGNMAFDVGRKTAVVLDCNVNTKLHRIMRHVPDHYFDYGCIRKGATDANETMHKETKRAYRSTNKHMQSIAQQLLSARATIEASSDNEEPNGRSKVQSQLLITRHPRAAISNIWPVDVQEEKNTEKGNLQDFQSDITLELAPLMQKHVEPGTCPKLAQQSVASALHPSTNLVLWKLVKSVRFMARVPWYKEQPFWATVYAGENVYGYDRRDAVLYSHGGQTHYGIVQAIFKYYNERKSRVALVRRLKEVSTEPGNEKVVTDFGNKRLGYVLSGNDIQIDCVESSFLQRPAMILPDPWVVTRLYGAHKRMNQVPDTSVGRKSIRFFEIAGFKYTSLEEQIQQ